MRWMAHREVTGVSRSRSGRGPSGWDSHGRGSETSILMNNLVDEPNASPGFRHEALFYAGEDDFLAGTVPFIVEGVTRDEPVLVVVSAPKIEALRRALNGAADRVQFADMAEVGRNPARIIPAWRDFVDEN